MSFNAIGDLANSLIFSHASLRAKNNIARFSQELTTGITSNIADRLRNDISPQVSWERSIKSAQVRENTLSEALVRVQAKQGALRGISELSTSLVNDLSIVLTSGFTSVQDAVTVRATDALKQTIGFLNTQVSGRSLFSGAKTDAPALAPIDEIVASAKAAAAGATNASDLTQRVQDWMNSPAAGFDADAYQGSNASSSPHRISDGATISETSKANDPALKKSIQQLVLLTLSVDSDFNLSHADQKEIISTASEGLRSADGLLTEERTKLGFVEAELSKAKTYASAEISTAELLRAEVLGVDQFETASRLQQAELQLEKIYMLTSRASNMSLLEYLR